MSFEAYKREALALERQLEDKVSRYQQLIQKYSGSTDALSRMEGGSNGSTTTTTSSSSSSSSSNHNTTTMTNLQQDIVLYQQEIPIVIQNLHDTIHKKLMVTAVTPSQRAITTRYEQVLRDTKFDYDRTKQQYIRYYERNELLFSSTGNNNNNNNNNNTNSGNGSSMGNNGTSTTNTTANTTADPAMEALFRERNSMSNSINHTSSVISQAEQIRNELHNQGRSLRNTNSIVGIITNNVPSVNTLIETIRRRRNSDDKIVAITIALCITFTFWYLFG